MRLAREYSPARMEAAAERALLMGACRYQSVKSILKNSLDMLPVATDTSGPTPSSHDWAMAPLTESDRRDFWEVCEDRYQSRSLILTSQLPVSKWHE